MPKSGSYDLAIVGAGICGLANALAAARRGKRIIVIDRDAQASGASVRNFGFVTVTGQQAGDCWRRAMRSRDVWLEIATAAMIPIVQRGLLMIARRREARAVLEEFLATEMGAECRLVAPNELTEFGSDLRAREFAGALFSPHEVRVESRDAIPQLAAYLAERYGVAFLPLTAVHAAVPPRLETSRGPIDAEAIVVCPGDDRPLRRSPRPIRSHPLQASHDARASGLYRSASARCDVRLRAEQGLFDARRLRRLRICGMQTRPDWRDRRRHLLPFGASKLPIKIERLQRSCAGNLQASPNAQASLAEQYAGLPFEA